ncbi:hypothetical protein OCU04_007183 [Sclerotinia nivalis]|uniref:Uncharacterized protein n=1 Tax=Sclerotinia nivalis TaxID=352851 RepID=A0A9X0DKE7_9HELO|nr:hypothetical protein OCU04_007183 [Sclerotinia nivalis]
MEDNPPPYTDPEVQPHKPTCSNTQARLTMSLSTHPAHNHHKHFTSSPIIYHYHCHNPSSLAISVTTTTTPLNPKHHTNAPPHRQSPKHQRLPRTRNIPSPHRSNNNRRTRPTQTPHIISP